MKQALALDRHTAEEFLFHEAELIDNFRFEDWHELFTDDAKYMIPLSDDEDTSRYASLVYDDALRLEERVYHLSKVPFPSQSPRSRTLHQITNVRVRPLGDAGKPSSICTVSNQTICEMRLGDFRQVGLGEQRILAAEVIHELVVNSPSDIQIASKTIRLLNRGAPIGNLTFIL